jgi:putative ABC transport system permease protein
MGIRKVLGASTARLLGFLSADIAKMVVLSSLIAMPLAYYLTTEWLKDYPYKDTTEWWQFLLPVMILLSLALFSVSAQILKLSKTNPVESIRYE